jgi:hypothetical protein
MCSFQDFRFSGAGGASEGVIPEPSQWFSFEDEVGRNDIVSHKAGKNQCGELREDWVVVRKKYIL